MYSLALVSARNRGGCICGAAAAKSPRSRPCVWESLLARTPRAGRGGRSCGSYASRSRAAAGPPGPPVYQPAHPSTRNAACPAIVYKKAWESAAKGRGCCFPAALFGTGSSGLALRALAAALNGWPRMGFPLAPPEGRRSPWLRIAFYSNRWYKVVHMSRGRSHMCI